MRKRIARITGGVLAFNWTIGWAAVSAVEAVPDLSQLPWLQSLIGIGVAALGGFAATLGRYAAALYEERPFLVRIEFLKDLVVSMAVGLGGYWLGFWSNTPPPLLALGLLLSGYLGTRILSAFAERFMLDMSKGQR